MGGKEKMERNNPLLNIHQGAREVEIDSLVQDIPGIEDLRITLRQFREVAYNANKKCILINENQDSYQTDCNEKFNNNISILGSRGMGKTSVLYTIIREIKNGTLFQKNINIKENCIDIINRPIDPEEISDNSDVLGWAIAALKEQINNLDKRRKTRYQGIVSNIESKDEYLDKLNRKHEELIRCYALYRKEFGEIYLSNSVTKSEYYSVLNDVLTSDYNLHKCFDEFINILICYKRMINRQYTPNNLDAEPLIYFFFDDVDMGSRKSVQLLSDILTYFAHPNIVIFVTGDYEVFQLSMMNYFMSETKDNTLKLSQKNKDNEVRLSRDRTEYFLKKVLPPAYRYYIKEATEDQIKIKYNYRDNSDNPFEKKDVLELLSWAFLLSFDKSKDPQSHYYLHSFYLPQIQKVNENNCSEDQDELLIQNEFTGFENKIVDNEKFYTERIGDSHSFPLLYAYLAVFSVNRRGFMNVYNYLCKEVNFIFNSHSITEPKNYWKINKFREFLKNIIISKHTFQKYEADINKFLSVKGDPSDDSESRQNDFTKLRIDCEELELFIKELINQLHEKSNESLELYTKTAEEELKQEIKSIIMLPILINELFFIVHKDNYEQRYLSIQRKLKNILTTVYINSLNEELMILPTKLGLRRTLCIFEQIHSRLSVASMKDLTAFYSPGYKNSNNKKYIVQLYYATAELGGYGANAIFDKYNYRTYRNSTYTDIASRSENEKEIAAKMNLIFSHLDREWLADKIKYATALEPTIYKLEYILHDNFMNKYQSILDEDFYNLLNEVYAIICDFKIDSSFTNYDSLDTNKMSQDPNKIGCSDHHNIGNIDWFKACLKWIICLPLDLESNTTLIDDDIDKNDLEQIENFGLVKQIYNLIDFKNNNASFVKNNSILIYEEIQRRLNNNWESNAKTQIKSFLNNLDDIKYMYEVLIDRLSNVLYEYYDIAYIVMDYFYIHFKEYITASRSAISDAIERYELNLIEHCAFHDREAVQLDLKSILSELYADQMVSINPETNEAQGSISKITNHLMRITRRQERVSMQEMKRITFIIKRYFKLYFLYSFILYACEIKNENDTEFFANFKSSIQYKNRIKNREEGNIGNNGK